jgi:hypothetical protein
MALTSLVGAETHANERREQCVELVGAAAEEPPTGNPAQSLGPDCTLMIEGLSHLISLAQLRPM